jgi:hypothetical protein
MAAYLYRKQGEHYLEHSKPLFQRGVFDVLYHAIRRRTPEISTYEHICQSWEWTTSRHLPFDERIDAAISTMLEYVCLLGIRRTSNPELRDANVALLRDYYVQPPLHAEETDLPILLID